MAFTVARAVAAALLIGALGQHPYDYYTVLRWVVCGVSAYGAFLAHERSAQTWTWVYGVIAVVFNPIAPVHLSRTTWAPINVAAGITMLVSVGLFRSGGRGPQGA